MKIKQGHLSYCTNIHPGESWAEVFSQLKHNLPELKAQICPNAPFGIGLRLSNRSASELSEPSQLASFKQWLSERQLYVFTINAFPYGVFHSEPVKETVYLPDWRSQDRLEYTQRVADILSSLLPEGVTGSISTVPCAYKAEAESEQERRLISDNLLSCAIYLDRLNQNKGTKIRLALEPEPSCLLEYCADVEWFFSSYLFSKQAIDFVSEKCQKSKGESADLLKQHLTVCLDTCHAAVMFEDPLDFARRMKKQGILIGKVQVTNALAIKQDTQSLTETLINLKAFSDEVYLHQTVIKFDDGSKLAFVDLPQALDYVQTQQATKQPLEWRIHYHVPTFLKHLNKCETSQEPLIDFLRAQQDTPVSEHFELETYTFDLLPDHHQVDGVVANVAREILWARELLET